MQLNLMDVYMRVKDNCVGEEWSKKNEKSKVLMNWTVKLPPRVLITRAEQVKHNCIGIDWSFQFRVQHLVSLLDTTREINMKTESE